ncbi:hypothetical protein ACJMK2_031925 [Sinanodonta woodiana]|uniref:Uncharacterized protein n=1 Tax=Sinanodonta woodiana TaxID=1069815 RepID=A0ABD3X3M7_SINWO
MIMRCVIISIMAYLALVNMASAMYIPGYYGYVPIVIGQGGYQGYKGNSFGGGFGSIIMIIVLLVVILPLLRSIGSSN